MSASPAVPAASMVRTVAWLGVAAIAVVSAVPGPLRPHLFARGQYEHFAAYVVTGCVLAWGYRALRSRILLGAALSVLAGALEVAQIWIPGRNPKVSDWLAGSLGAWSGIAIVMIALQLHARWGVRASYPK